MNKAAKVLGLKKSAKNAVKCVGSAIASALKKREKVTLVGFGTFSVAKRAARKAKNPRTSDETKIKAKNVPKFAP